MGEERAFLELLTGPSQFEPLVHGTEPIASPEALGVLDAATFAINRVIRSEDDRRELFNEVQVNNAAEGSGIPIIMGPKNSIKGQWLWLSNIFQRAPDLGDVVTRILTGEEDNYFDVVFAMSVGMTAVPGKKANVERIYADGKEVWNRLFFTAFGQHEVTGTDIAVENTTYNGRDVMRLTSVTTDFGGFFENGISGVETYGFTNANNNRDQSDVNVFNNVNRVIRLDGETDGPWTMDLLDPANTAVTESAGNSITLIQNFADWDTFLNGRIWTQIGFLGFVDNPSLNNNNYFDGTNNDQEPFKLFLSLSPVVLKPQHPAYKRLVWFFGQMGLGSFNNRVPDFRCEVAEVTGEANEQKPIGDAVGDIMGLAGFDACEYDTTGLSGNLRGYTIYPPVNGARVLQPLFEGYNITPYEDWGKLWFINRGGENIVTLESGKMGAHEPGSDVPRPLLLTQEADFEQPSAVTVKYLDTTLDMQQSAETVRRHNADVDKIMEVELPLALTPSEARTIGNRVLWNAWQNSTKITIHLPPRYLYLHEQHKIQLTEDGRSYNFIVTDVQEGANFILEVTGFIESLNPFNETVIGEVSNPGGASDLYLPPFMELYAHDLAPMSQTIVDESKSGFYAQTAALDPSAEFIKAEIWCNYIDTANENYDSCAAVIVESSMGFSTTSLADAPVATTGLWDRSSTVTVQLFQGGLTSQTENKILRAWDSTDGFKTSSANIARLGDEIIGFSTVVDNGDNTFTLSNLLRGLRNTMDATGSHSSGEEFHVVTLPNNNIYVGMSEGQYQALDDVRLRSIPDSGNNGSSDVYELTFAKGLRAPFSVALQGHRGYNYLNTTADDDEITVAWFPRMKGFMSMFGEWYRDEDTPTSGIESYGVLFRADDTANTLLASKALSFTPDTGDDAYKGYRTTTWTEAEQTTTAVSGLGHLLGDTVIVQVFKTIIGYNGKISSVTIA